MELQTERKLAILFKTIADSERFIESIREQLCGTADYSLHGMFKSLERFNNGYLTAEDIQNYLSVNHIYADYMEIYNLVRQYDSNNDGKLSYADLHHMLNPGDKHGDHSMSSMGHVRRSSISGTTNLILIEFLSAEIDTIRALEVLKNDLSRSVDFNLDDGFNAIDINRRGEINPADMIAFLQKNQLATTFNDCYAISRRIGGEEGYLSYQVFTDGVLPNNPVEVTRTQRTVEEYNMDRGSVEKYNTFARGSIETYDSVVRGGLDQSYNLDRDIQELSIISQRPLEGIISPLNHNLSFSVSNAFPSNPDRGRKRSPDAYANSSLYNSSFHVTPLKKARKSISSTLRKTPRPQQQKENLQTPYGKLNTTFNYNSPSAIILDCIEPPKNNLIKRDVEPPADRLRSQDIADLLQSLMDAHKDFVIQRAWLITRQNFTLDILFQQMDPDNLGYFTMYELDRYLKYIKIDLKPEELRQVWSFYNANDSAKITKRQFWDVFSFNMAPLEDQKLWITMEQENEGPGLGILIMRAMRNFVHLWLTTGKISELLKAKPRLNLLNFQPRLNCYKAELLAVLKANRIMQTQLIKMAGVSPARTKIKNWEFQLGLDPSLIKLRWEKNISQKKSDTRFEIFSRRRFADSNPPKFGAADRFAVWLFPIETIPQEFESLRQKNLTPQDRLQALINVIITEQELWKQRQLVWVLKMILSFEQTPRDSAYLIIADVLPTLSQFLTQNDNALNYDISRCISNIIFGPSLIHDALISYNFIPRIIACLYTLQNKESTAESLVYSLNSILDKSKQAKAIAISSGVTDMLGLYFQQRLNSVPLVWGLARLLGNLLTDNIPPKDEWASVMQSLLAALIQFRHIKVYKIIFKIVIILTQNEQDDYVDVVFDSGVMTEIARACGSEWTALEALWIISPQISSTQLQFLLQGGILDSIFPLIASENEKALFILWNLCSDEAWTINTILNMPGFTQVLQLRSHSKFNIRREAINILANCAMYGDANSHSMLQNQNAQKAFMDQLDITDPDLIQLSIESLDCMLKSVGLDLIQDPEKFREQLETLYTHKNPEISDSSYKMLTSYFDFNYN